MDAAQCCQNKIGAIFQKLKNKYFTICFNDRGILIKVNCQFSKSEKLSFNVIIRLIKNKIDIPYYGLIFAFEFDIEKRDHIEKRTMKNAEIYFFKEHFLPVVEDILDDSNGTFIHGYVEDDDSIFIKYRLDENVIKEYLFYLILTHGLNSDDIKPWIWQGRFTDIMPGYETYVKEAKENIINHLIKPLAKICHDYLFTTKF